MAAPTSIPSNFLVVVDSGGANDQNAEQRDLTQMGRDDTSNPSVYDLFWSWDTTNFTEQKGNACALFDSDGDGLINFAVCAEVETTTSGDPDVVKETARSPIAVTCDDSRADRCRGPHPASVAGVLSGDLVNVDRTADLVTATDPFPDLDHDQTWPYDSTIRLQVPKSSLPAGAELANVCLYPSLGDTGNNSPSDCILRPANGLLKITKVAPAGTTQSFDFTLNPGGIARTITGSGSTAPIGLTIAGDYAVGESVPSGWSLTSATCTKQDGSTTGTFSSANHNVTGISVESGRLTTCTFTDAVQPSHLTLVKVVHNDHGGSEAATAWTLSASGPTNISGATGSAAVTNAAVTAGVYTLSESGPAGYDASAWSCTGNAAADTASSVTVGLGENVTCTISNSDQQPQLTLVKVVHNDNGGTAVAGDWTLSASGPTSISGVTGAAAVTDAAVDAGTYTLSESGPAGYDASAWSCTGNGTAVDGDQVTILPGETVQCSITNTSQPASLELTKYVDNTNGGNATPTDWSLSATPQDIPGQGIEGGAGGFAPRAVFAGTYLLGEAGPDGYTNDGWTCTGGSLSGAYVTIDPGETVSCDITNHSQKASLQLTKTVDNGTTGATHVPGDWLLSAQGLEGLETVSGAGGFAPTQVVAGDYDLAESGGPSGYTTTGWVCSGNDTALDGTVLTLKPGETVSCSIENVAQQPTLKLTKIVTTDHGGTAVATDWTLTATPQGIGGQSQVSGAGGFAATPVKVGDYLLGESGPGGYDASVWSCSGGTLTAGVVTVVQGQAVECTITNSDQQPHLTLVKVVHNDHGGTGVVGDWTLSASGPSPISGVTGSVAVTDAAVDAGTYALSETGPAGYDASAWSCTSGLSGSSVTVGLGESVKCTIENSDQQPHLTLVKAVSNTHGGVLAPTDWTLSASGPSPISGASGAAAVTNAAVNAGTYTLSESGPTGYDASMWACVAGTTPRATGTGPGGATTVAVGLGESVSCTITNSDLQPFLTLVKVVENTHGGTATAGDWTLSASGPSPISGVSGDGAVTGAPVLAGLYSLGESGPAGYDASAWSCAIGTAPVATGTGPGGVTTVPVGLGESVVCTITNSDQQPHLTLVKVVENDDGGTAVPADWMLGASGPTSFAGWAGSADVTDVPVDAGVYTLGESGPAGYDTVGWTCLGNAAPVSGLTLTVGLGESITCTITNRDLQPHLTLVKAVVNDHGGTQVAGAWTLSASGPTSISGATGAAAVTGVEVSGGVYTLGESGPAGYDSLGWSCVGNAAPLAGSTLLVGLGESVTCTVTNRDQQPYLTLAKVVENDDGGTAVATAWTLSASGPSPISGPTGGAAVTTAQVNAGVYTLSESGPSGYDPSAWSCVGNAAALSGSTLTVGLGETVTCTITNSDQQPHLTLVKEVSNTHGGTAAASAWTLSAAGPTPISGASGLAAVTDAEVNAGAYTLSESGPGGYDASAWSCTGNAIDESSSAVTVLLGESVTCTITNSDQQPHLTLVKEVSNTHGGTAAATAWTLSADGPTSISGGTGTAAVTAAAVDAGLYTLSESGPAGYDASAWSCAIGTAPVATGTGPGGVTTVPVGLGESVVCTITNSDQQPHLTLVKEVSNTHGGTAAASAWTLSAAGPTTISGVTGTAAVTNAPVDAGLYALSESNMAGYDASAWSCTSGLAGSSVTVGLGESVTCTITNSDQQPYLTLVKAVEHPHGGTATVDEWTLSAAGPTPISGKTGDDAVTHAAVNAGTYTLAESGPSGYDQAAWICTGNEMGVEGSSLTILLGESVTCTVTNSDQQPLLTLKKAVSNTHGGSAAAGAWTLKAAGLSTISGATGSAEVTDAPVDAGLYALTESGPSGYAASAWVCLNGDQPVQTGPGTDGATLVPVDVGQSITCTVTNSDLPGVLTLLKTVDNGLTGAGAVPANWTLTATPDAIDGQAAVTGSGDPLSAGGVNGVEVFAGTYTLSESGGPAGYTAGAWTCNGGVLDPQTAKLTVANGADVTCAITNTAVAPLLTLVKAVDNTAGGTAAATDFTLTAASGAVVLSGIVGAGAVTGVPVPVGTYALSESGPSGYTASAWTCSAGSLAGNQVTLALGEVATCSITNTAVSAAVAGVTTTRPHPSGGVAGVLATTGAMVLRYSWWAFAAILFGLVLTLGARRRHRA